MKHIQRESDSLVPLRCSDITVEMGKSPEKLVVEGKEPLAGAKAASGASSMIMSKSGNVGTHRSAPPNSRCMNIICDRADGTAVSAASVAREKPGACTPDSADESGLPEQERNRLVAENGGCSTISLLIICNLIMLSYYILLLVDYVGYSAAEQELKLVNAIGHSVLLLWSFFLFGLQANSGLKYNLQMVFILSFSLKPLTPMAYENSILDAFQTATAGQIRHICLLTIAARHCSTSKSLIAMMATLLLSELHSILTKTFPQKFKLE